MQDIFVKFAYLLESSTLYINIRNFTDKLLNDTRYKGKRYFDFLMIFFVLSTIGILIYEVNHPAMHYLNDYETLVIYVFVFEWLGRLWTSSNSHKCIIEDYEKSQLRNHKFSLGFTLKKIIKDKFGFIFSPMSLIDLMAILPSYRPLRVFRILMLFRLFKLLRYANSVKQFAEVFKDKKFELLTLIIIFSMAVVFGSTIIFIYEGGGINPNIHNYFDAIYWSVITISTVGFGDISPITIEGRVMTLFLVIVGLSILAFFTSIVTTALEVKLVSIKENKIIKEANSINDFILICGYGQMGKVLVKELSKIKQKFIVVDFKEEAVAHAYSQQIMSIQGDATDPEFLETLGIQKGAKAVVAITNSDSVNVAITLASRVLNPNIFIIARVNNAKMKDKLLLAGANQVVVANDITALVASEYLGQPIAYEAISDILLHSENAVLEELTVLENSKLIGKTLDKLDNSHFNLTILGIMQNNRNFIFNPKKDEYIVQKGDILIVIGFADSITYFKQNFFANKVIKND